MKSLLFIIASTSLCLLLISFAPSNADCGLKWVWLDDPDTSGTNIRTKPNGQIISIVKNNLKREEYIMFDILESKGNWLSVQCILPDGKENDIKGWIYAPLTAAHTRNYDGSIINIYAERNITSPHVGEIKGESKVNLLGCEGKWSKIRYTSSTGKIIEGFIQSDKLCGNIYSTCS